MEPVRVKNHDAIGVPLETKFLNTGCNQAQRAVVRHHASRSTGTKNHARDVANSCEGKHPFGWPDLGYCRYRAARLSECVMNKAKNCPGTGIKSPVKHINCFLG